MEYSSGTSGGVKIAAPKPVNSAQEILQRLTALKEQFGMNGERLQRVVDRAYGPAKQGEQANAAPRAVPSGEIGAIIEALEDLSAIAANQGSTIDRVDGIV